MGRHERAGGKRSGSRSNTFEDFKSSRGKGRSSRSGRDGSNFELTSVICASCHERTEVPFRPTTTKPVYCRSCFNKDGSGESRDNSKFSKPRDSKPRDNSDLKDINKKLDKIMKALKIE